jgi:RHS repeat-associated protein
VLDRSAVGLPGVKVSVHDHPEFGHTLSRADGAFDLAVNGGGQVTLDYEKENYLPSQRAELTPWRDYVWFPEVVLVPLDPVVTTIELSAASAQVARGSTVTDSSGTRQATLIVPSGTQAGMTFRDGSFQQLTSMRVRATEYTIGDNGPMAMPATLPPTSAYTYAVELSVDEAIAAGATGVQFNQAVPLYVENYLGFSVGGAVPYGFYDRVKAQWVAAHDGRVIGVLSVDNGKAELDIDGSGVAADAIALNALGVTDEELAKVAQLYTPGQTLWRTPIAHFTPGDCNWPPAPPLDAIKPWPPVPKNPVVNKPNKKCGSQIGCELQTLGESVPLAGLSTSLYYQSERTPGRKANRNIEVPLSGTSVSDGLLKMRAEVSVAGRAFQKSFSPAPGMVWNFGWDGKDAYGREVVSEQVATIKVSYDYAMIYYPAKSGSDSSFARIAAIDPTATMPPPRTNIPFTLSTTWTQPLALLDARRLGLGGWSLGIHHSYDKNTHSLLMGNGQVRRAETYAGVIQTVAGTGLYNTPLGDGGLATNAKLKGPRGVAVGPDGSLYICDSFQYRVRRVSPEGIITTFAGNGNTGSSGDGGPATSAQLYYPAGIALGPDGSVYISDVAAYVVRRVDPRGIITTVAGDGQSGYQGGTYVNMGDGGPATRAHVNPITITVAADGGLYIVDGALNSIRHVGTDGIITTVAGNGTRGFSGDGGPATKAQLIPRSVAIASDGTLYIADDTRVRKVGVDGIISTIAGTGTAGFSGDGGAAKSAQFNGVSHVVLDREGNLFLNDSTNNRIRRIGTEGVVTTVAGSVLADGSGDGGPALNAGLVYITGLAIGPNGDVFISDATTERVRRVQPVMPDFSVSESTDGASRLLASEDGREVYVFDGNGRHLKTLEAMTGALRYQFGYDADGYLVSVTDGSGNITHVERDGAKPKAIVAPGGQRTALEVDEAGWLSTITNPAGEAYSMTSSPEGLLQNFTEPGGAVHSFAFDDLGNLTKDTDPLGGSTTLARTEQENGYTVTATTALGRTSSYQVQVLPTRAVRRIMTTYSGATTTTLISADGSEQTTYSDGGSITTRIGPDPRWGMLTPVTTSIVATTPANLKRTVKTTRTASLANPNDPFSLTTLTNTVDDTGSVRTRVYDASSRTYTETSSTGSVSTLTLDALGRPASYTPAADIDALVYGYNANGKLASLTQDGNLETITYDSENRVSSVSNGTGENTTYGYDDADRLASVKLPSNASYQFGYDSDGRMASVTMPSGATHQLSYTAIGQDKTYTPPGDAKSVAWKYDVDRAWTETDLPNGEVLSATYDSFGRPSGRSYGDSTVTYSYNDNTSRMTSITKGSTTELTQTLNLGFDAELVTALTFAGAAEAAFGLSYDNHARLANLTLTSKSDSVSIATTRDSDGRVTQYGPFTFARDAGTDIVSNISDGKLNSSYGHDTRGRINKHSVSVNGVALYSATIGYDLANRVATRVETVQGTTHTFIYSYDGGGQLVGVKRDGTDVESYAYDPNGNRTTPAASYDSQDRLLALGNAPYIFDPNGALLARDADLFAYSARGELLSAQVGPNRVTYTYDGLGRRVARQVGSASTTQYLYGNPGNPFQLTAARISAGTLQMYYYDARGMLIAIRQGTTYLYVASDELGTPRIVSDASGAVIKALDYDSFGRLIGVSGSNPAFELPIGYAGGIEDSVTGLVHFGYRDYDPAAGRWTARDPALYGGSQWNLYVYVSNNPIGRNDSIGLFSVGGSAYLGIGGGFKIVIDRKGFKVCGELGSGLGGEIAVDPLEAVGNTNTQMQVVGEVGLGPFGAGVEISEGDCYSLSVKAGPFKGKFEGPDSEFSGFELSNFELPLKAEGKLSLMFCGGMKW